MSAKATHYLRIEVTVAAAITGIDDSKTLGDNMAAVTLAFGQGIKNFGYVPTDVQIQQAVIKGVSPVVGTIGAILKELGYLEMGEVEDPMTGHSTPTGEMARTLPGRVIVLPSDGPVQ
jgi:hypothetical protein